ncbi:MAG: 23S rRNA (adenine2503-C2)-methyltransferase [Saprospiraceae bacterium]
MNATSEKINLLSLNRQGLEAFFLEIGEKAFRATQIIKWIYQNGVTDFDEMTNISKSLRTKLAQTCEIQLPVVDQMQLSNDGTRKWLMRLSDGNAIEVVFIPEEDRGTLCISSQVGCSLNCTFCATARQGFNRNLTPGEIVGQVWHAWHSMAKETNSTGFESKQSNLPGEKQVDTRPITNIVLMGMGEPLLNYDAVVTAIGTLRDDFGFGLSKRRITLSTAGMVPAIAKLSEDMPVSLAVSLHATTDELRNQLVPLNKKYPISVLLEACKAYVNDKQRQRITFEYLMLDGINDSDEQALELARLLKDVPSKVNLIPFNPVEGINFIRSPEKRVNRFRDILLSKGIVTMTRKTRGDDIDAACGQLVGKVDDRTKRSQRMTAQYVAQPTSA